MISQNHIPVVLLCRTQRLVEGESWGREYSNRVMNSSCFKDPLSLLGALYSVHSRSAFIHPLRPYSVTTRTAPAPPPYLTLGRPSSNHQPRDAGIPHKNRPGSEGLDEIILLQFSVPASAIHIRLSSSFQQRLELIIINIRSISTAPTNFHPAVRHRVQNKQPRPPSFDLRPPSSKSNTHQEVKIED